MSKTKKRTGKPKDFIKTVGIKELEKFLPIRNEKRNDVADAIGYHQVDKYLVNEGYIFKMGEQYIDTMVILNITLNKKSTLVTRGIFPINKFKGDIAIYMRRNDLKVTKLTLFNMKLVNTELYFKEHLGGFTYKFVSRGRKSKYSFELIKDITKDKEWAQILKLK